MGPRTPSPLYPARRADRHAEPRAFISGPGRGFPSGRVDVAAGDDDGDGAAAGALCYRSTARGVFPFHGCCYELLARVLARGGSGGSAAVDKERLFAAMWALWTEHGRYVTLGLDYCGAEEAQNPWWACIPGDEYLVVQPAHADGLVAPMRQMLAGDAFRLGGRRRPPPPAPPCSTGCRTSCWRPCSTCSTTRPCWPSTPPRGAAHAALHGNNGFWTRRFRQTMPWFSEALDVLDGAADLRRTDLKRFYLWARSVSRPRRFVRGPFMAVANRRRIWGVCEQINARYCAEGATAAG